MAHQTWSDAWNAYIAKRFGDNAPQKASFALKVAYSVVHYWCNGSRPRDAMRKRIQRWSGGEVSADLPGRMLGRPRSAATA